MPSGDSDFTDTVANIRGSFGGISLETREVKVDGLQGPWTGRKSGSGFGGYPGFGEFGENGEIEHQQVIVAFSPGGVTTFEEGRPAFLGRAFDPEFVHFVEHSGKVPEPSTLAPIPIALIFLLGLHPVLRLGK